MQLRRWVIELPGASLQLLRPGVELVGSSGDLGDLVLDYGQRHQTLKRVRGRRLQQLKGLRQCCRTGAGLGGVVRSSVARELGRSGGQLARPGGQTGRTRIQRSRAVREVVLGISGGRRRQYRGELVRTGLQFFNARGQLLADVLSTVCRQCEICRPPT